MRAFDRAASIDPPSPKSAGQVNKILVSKGRKMEALDRAGQMVKKYKDSPQAWSVYGSALLLGNANVPAYQAFKRAAELDSTNYLFWGNAGSALFKAQTNAPEWTRILKDEAVPQARAVLRDAPGNLQVRTHLATYEAALGEPSSGLSQSDRDEWNRAALADADIVLIAKPFLPNIIFALETPYDIMDRTDRVSQCEAWLHVLSSRPVKSQSSQTNLPSP
ncbi:MAG: hypothetical protein WDM80_16380 [Limisphaerales bacterium]